MPKSIVWCGSSKKRKIANDEDDNSDGEEQMLPPIVFGKAGTSSVHSHFNHVYFSDDITHDTAFCLNKELRATDVRIRTTAAALGIEPPPLYLHITSNGGAIHAAFSVVDCISQLSVKVHTVADGFVASAATLITLAGEKRFITDNAYMLIHELRSGVWGKMTSIDEEFANLKKIMEHITSFYTKRTSFNKKCLEKILTKDLIWNAQECLDKGLVDEFYKS